MANLIPHSTFLAPSVVRFNTTHRRLLKVLGDGQPHTKRELIDALAGLGITYSAFFYAIHSLRRRIILIDPQLNVVTRRDGDNHTYQLVKQVPAVMSEWEDLKQI